ncbi:GNAT family N-acetyltransferase [Pseudoflavonifractor phocaeensis]|uniref:GNAT family N-acetyltransferase n=1 Tax=Pseudoflavonifractor phocaeensis TaxID=1870988 RepID=UPI00195D55CF|nr:GNAT family N-acetyltransferase [Pseudoflavonifractor phocaeensis]MBM6924836.1 GNAT family N-acetyltransferase [Pseudoflavonifractor phocaeensis]
MDTDHGAIGLRAIDAALLPAFVPYLTGDTVRAIGGGMPGLTALGAVTGDLRACAAVAGRAEGEGLTLSSLYVDPQIRRQGVGSALLEALLAQTGPRRTEASWFLPEEEGQTLAAFLAARGFRAETDETPICRLDMAMLRRVPSVRRAFSPAFRPDGNIVPFDRLTPEELADLEADPSIDPRLRPGQAAGRLTPQLSFCYRYRGRIAAYFLCGQTGPDALAVLAAVSRQGAHPAAFLQLVTAAIHQGLIWFGGDFVCWLEALNDTSLALARTISGGTLQLWREGRASLELERLG